MTFFLALLMLGQSHLERGYSLAQSGDLKAAEAELRLAVKEAPNDPQALAILGIALSQQGKLTEATPYLERALKIEPGDTNARYNLALNQLRLGKPAAALANLARVVREHAECSPCLLRECPIDHRCMTRVTAGPVAAAALQLWEESAPAWTPETRS